MSVLFQTFEDEVSAGDQRIIAVKVGEDEEEGEERRERRGEEKKIREEKRREGGQFTVGPHSSNWPLLLCLFIILLKVSLSLCIASTHHPSFSYQSKTLPFSDMSLIRNVHVTLHNILPNLGDTIREEQIAR